MNIKIQKDTNIESSYHRAAFFQNAVSDMNRIAKNTSLIPHWIQGTDCFWYRRRTEFGVQFRLVDSNSKTNIEAFDHRFLASYLASITNEDIDYKDLPIKEVEIKLSPFRVTFSAFDKYYFFDENKKCQIIEKYFDLGSLERLVSPDEKTIAFVRDYNLWIQNIDSGEETALTQDGEKFYSYATAPMLWGLPLNSLVQARWSSDSKTLLTVQTDNRKVKRTPVINYVPQDGSIRPTVDEYPCGYPGDEYVEEQRILAIDIDTGRQQKANYRRVPVSRSAYGLFTDNLAWWSQSSQYAYFVDLERGYQQVRVVEFNVKTGTTRIILEESSSTYLNLSPSEGTPATLLPLPESNELIWYSERTGWGHLYLYDLETGSLKYPLTKGEWMVREILHFDNEKRELFFQTGGRHAEWNPYYLDICRIDIDTQIIREIIASPHEYTVLGSLAAQTMISMFSSWTDPDWQIDTCGVSPSGRFLVATRSRADQTPVNLLFDRDGDVMLELEEADVSNLPKGWCWPEPVDLLAADGITKIYGVIFRPSDFSPSKKYPVIDCSNCSAEFSAAPKGSFNNSQLAGVWYLQAAALAELGFIVVTIDGRGTAYRDRDFVNASYGWAPLANNPEDRIAGIKQLAERYSYMDLGRVGIIGFEGSVGAVYGLLEYPEFYKVGVSHALQDTRVMSTTWGEQYEGLESAEINYDFAETLAGNLQGKLLLMHGLLDRMDHSAATWRLVNALQKANKDFDMLIFPTGEGVAAHIGSVYAFRRTWDYFVRHLLNTEPPEEFDFNQIQKDKTEW